MLLVFWINSFKPWFELANPVDWLLIKLINIFFPLFKNSLYLNLNGIPSLLRKTTISSGLTNPLLFAEFEFSGFDQLIYQINNL